jgi:hypothetical protein
MGIYPERQKDFSLMMNSALSKTFSLCWWP